MNQLIEIQNASDWTGERSIGLLDRLLPILYPDSENLQKSSIQSSDFVFKIFKASFNDYYRHHYYGKRCYYYSLPSGSIFHTKYKGKSLYRKKWEKTPCLNDPQKEVLRIFLTRDLGLGSRLAAIAASRTYITWMRIEEFISGFVDSLWLADSRVFLKDSSDRRIIIKVVRKIVATGVFNLGTLVDFWKEYGNYVFHTLAQTKLIGGQLSLSKYNFFKHLNQLSFIKRVLDGSKTQRDMQNIAHLMSSRQMPYMGIRTEEKARETFRSVLESDYRPPAWLEKKMFHVAFRIGATCKRLSPGRIHPGALHFSVTSSGEFDHPAQKGAQASAVMDGLKRHLDIIPETSIEEKTPFGICKHIAGIPLWKTAFRPDTLDTELSFLDTYRYVEGQPDRVMGLDDYTGIQIMYAAWKDRDSIPLVRAEVVPEMGNKARHVTVSAYWLGVLQAPLGHALIEALKWHPSCFSSFHREDQAWAAAQQLARVNRPLGKDEWILSSDLKDATNAQQWGLTKSMLRGFMMGYGMNIFSPYAELAIETIGPRLVLLHDDTTVLSNVGIMMGEPLAKPSLTLLNLCIEELAFLEYTNHSWLLRYLNRFDRPDPKRPWRCYHIGGDDHLARGPLPYLERITELHRLCGSHIDPGKHGYSRVCVKYTERVINLLNLDDNPKEVDPNDYCHSLIVDNIKVRLLERGLSTEQKKDNKNVAIGKSKQLGNVLAWLPKDDRLYPEGKVVSIRKLFIKRMGNLLPSESAHPRAFANIHLPIELGGYGLGSPEEHVEFLLKSPEPTQYLVLKALTFGGYQDMSKDIRIFSKLNHNTSIRGISSMTDFMEQALDAEAARPFERDPTGFGMRKVTYEGELSSDLYKETRWYATWNDVCTSYEQMGDSPRRVVDRAANEGWVSQHEFVNRCCRGLLFQTLLLGKEKLSLYNTVPYVKTYHDHIWKWYESEGGKDWDLSVLSTLQPFELKRLLRGLKGMWYVNIDATAKVAIASESIDQYSGEVISTIVRGPRLKLETWNLPNLQVSDKHLNILKKF